MPEGGISDAKKASSVEEMKRWFWAFSSGGRMCIRSNINVVNDSFRSLPTLSLAEVIDRSRISTSFEVLEECGRAVCRSVKAAASSWGRRCRAELELPGVVWRGKLLCLRWQCIAVSQELRHKTQATILI